MALVSVVEKKSPHPLVRIFACSTNRIADGPAALNDALPKPDDVHPQNDRLRVRQVQINESEDDPLEFIAVVEYWDGTMPGLPKLESI